MTEPLKTTVLISGGGSNLQALIDARDSGRLNVDITHVISNVADAGGLDRAERAGISSSVLPHGDFDSRDAFDRALALLIAASAPDLVVLAGFMRIIGAPVLEPFQGRLINLHPSLLPLYRGTETYRRAIESGDRQHGASIHFVTAQLDGGPVISQVTIPIETQDSPDTLAARLSPEEHALIVATVELFTRHRVECADDVVLVDGLTLVQPLQLQADGRLDP
ncbi:MAG: phosphoribosylglycinamide formyltransferase [Xanthomonadales bacterium]|jgi:phosphoribosylglycinamide formyltransferase-1|nr:phosphoribosylglycinamide formyltransferase [Xanthomonadales bacterium]MDH3940459.1 phosphoribosylglycinamide formyltransferase [Xanthomonadales bacterium]MDH4002675.1 phosphoribosylglycinamide formyltransferase [Xanthomonadales bacterium]